MNTDFDIKMHEKKRGFFFLEGFASPEGPGPGPYGSNMVPYGPTWKIVLVKCDKAGINPFVGDLWGDLI